ncbi:MAG: hypothetical protein HRU80_01680 [Ignavibacteriales bacterium]|nr:MAG: hypothetical protein HRU80_01680 [Ignavibacteriales bacterium]
MIINPSEDSFRNGYGDIKSLNELLAARIEVLEMKGYKISFLITDDSGWFLFPESHIFQSDTTGPNAFEMTRESINYIVQQYLNPEIIIETPHPKKINTEEVKIVERKLQANPPVAPDMRRILNIYNAKIQFVEFKFEGAKLSEKTIKIPQQALPIHDKNLQKRIDSTIKLFREGFDNEVIKRISDLSNFVDYLRAGKGDGYQSGYLIPIKCREKSIIFKDKREEFDKHVRDIREEIDKLRKDNSTLLQVEVLNTRKNFRQELTNYYNENKEKYLPNGGSGIELLIEKKVDDIIAQIRFPDDKKLLSKLSLTCTYYDLTYEDFSDEELLNEFLEKSVITQADHTQIVTFIKGVELFK